MKKIISTFLISVFILISFGIGPAPIKKAEAALNPGQTVSYRIYHTQLRNYLLSANDNPAIRCNVAPRPGSCLSLNMVGKIMDWVRDPNGDGDKSDGLLTNADSGYRLAIMQNATRNGFHPWVMSHWVIPWEKRTHYRIITPDLAPNVAVQASDTYWTGLKLALLDAFPQWRFVGDYATGDALIRDLAYHKDPNLELAPGVPRLILKPKSKVSTAAKNKLYGVRRTDGTWEGGVSRMIAFRESKYDIDPNSSAECVGWIPEECEAMTIAISFQNSVETRMTSMWNEQDGSDRTYNYQLSKALVGFWDATMVGLDLIPPVKIGRMIAAAKSGAQKSNTFARTAKMTVGGRAMAVETVDVARSAGSATRPTEQEMEMAWNRVDEWFKIVYARLNKHMPRENRNITRADFVFELDEFEKASTAGRYHGLNAEGKAFIQYASKWFTKDQLAGAADRLSRSYSFTREIIIHEMIHMLRHRALNWLDVPSSPLEETIVEWATRQIITERGLRYTGFGYGGAGIDFNRLIRQAAARNRFFSINAQARMRERFMRMAVSGEGLQFPQEMEVNLNNILARIKTNREILRAGLSTPGGKAIAASALTADLAIAEELIRNYILENYNR